MLSDANLCWVVVVAITVRQAKDVYQISARIENGTFNGKWHFSFDNYYDYDKTGFGPLKSFNDNLFSPGASYPVQLRRDFELVTYCATGEYQFIAEGGKYASLKKGWTLMTTMGKGLRYREVNPRTDMPSRVIQMWFLPGAMGLPPEFIQKSAEREARTNRFNPIVSNHHHGSLKIHQDVSVYACYLKKEAPLLHQFRARNAYFYVIEGGPVMLNGREIMPFSAVKIDGEPIIRLEALADAEILMIDMPGKIVQRKEIR